jgi:hypothetical protein
MADLERKMGAPPANGQQYQMQTQPDYGYQQNGNGQGYPPNGGQQGWQQNNGYPPNQQQYQPPKQGYPQPDGQGFQPPDGPPPSYDQTFAVERPRYNDLWAGILVCSSHRGEV